MADTLKPPTAGWRIPKACQECRKRKIRCNGLTPCKTCQQRNTPCVYRDVIRHRRKKNEYPQSDTEGRQPRQISPPVPQSFKSGGPSMMLEFPNSVSATHMASPSCQMQLYYGPTSHFSLMQHIYRDLVSTPTIHPAPSGEVEEAGAGLDLFSFRRIFFGTPDTHDLGKSAAIGDIPMMFLPYELAKLFLSRFLTHLYHMLPHRPKSYYEQCLEKLYNPSPTIHPDTLTQAIVLIGLATGSLGTEHYAWGDVLFDRVKVSLVQYANYQNEQGRPNSAFLHLGTAARKALSAGLHKDVPHGDSQDQETIEERRVTFWSLYAFETWFCFHVGRPSSLSIKDVATEYAKDPFIRLLAELCKTVSRSGNEIYGQRHESLLHMWKVARSITHDLRGHEVQMQQALGFGLNAGIQSGSLGVRQTIFITLYYHTLLLTIRPFLIFRGHWQRDMKMSLQQPNGGSASRPTEMPTWLNEACNHALTAARKTIHHLCEASRSNDFVKQLRYHGYFLGSSAFTLIYDLLHDPSTATTHLPWIYATLQNLSTMREGDPINSTISAIQTTLRKISPAYEWSPYPKADESSTLPSQNPASVSQPISNIDHQAWVTPDPSVPQRPFFNQQPDLSSPQWNLPLLEGPETGGSGGSSDDLLDFTQSDMGWNFDFSTMDLEAFFSTYQAADPAFL
ncbi:uncharacterized protein N7496_005630 [Penicillium cataractarum]|uniref:Zn(2)-C6 fungal-type domain-containing protein n=1 Tax=Penicillium cataractarum TaxID=2100454 RepID=A0A9W9VG82_9EURO|nr:uncharacterized protein N7496_005630 [Penicillium cataractarum]KAJ5378221.1 hypothetical protein N7496_005630 [Penicillium cataractarum]